MAVCTPSLTDTPTRHGSWNIIFHGSGELLSLQVHRFHFIHYFHFRRPALQRGFHFRQQPTNTDRPWESTLTKLPTTLHLVVHLEIHCYTTDGPTMVTFQTTTLHYLLLPACSFLPTTTLWYSYSYIPTDLPIPPPILPSFPLPILHSSHLQHRPWESTWESKLRYLLHYGILLP